MLTLFLGAGFSKWAAGLPLASQLFDFAIEPFGIRERQRLDRVRESKHAWDAVNPTGLAEQFIAKELASDDVRSQEDLRWYLVRRLSEPYVWQEWRRGASRRHVLMIDEYRKWQRPGVQTAADFITQFGSQLAGIVTLNYDLIVEYAMGSRGFNYGRAGEILKGRGPYPVSQWLNPTALTGRFPLAKLRGSISWDAGTKYTDGRRGLTGKALIVAPTPEKLPPKELHEQWALSSRLLRRSSRMIVFGFGFNVYDAAVLAHLADAGRGLVDVAIVDVSSRTEAAAHLWPGAHITSFQPPPQGTDQLRAWFASGAA